MTGPDGLVWLLLTLASYRLFRLVALDTLPPLVRVRERLDAGIRGQWGDGWADGLTCPHCSGAWCCLAVFGVYAALYGLPLPAVQIAAASTVVGLVGAKVDG